MTHLAIQQGLEYTLTNRNRGGILYLGTSEFTFTVSNISFERSYFVRSLASEGGSAWSFRLTFSHSLFEAIELAAGQQKRWKIADQEEHNLPSIISLQYIGREDLLLEPERSISIVFQYTTLREGIKSGTDFTCAITAKNIHTPNHREIGHYLARNIHSVIQSETPLHVQLDVVQSRQILTDIEAQDLSNRIKTKYITYIAGEFEEFGTMEEAILREESEFKPIEYEHLHLHHTDLVHTGLLPFLQEMDNNILHSNDSEILLEMIRSEPNVALYLIDQFPNIRDSIGVELLSEIRKTNPMIALAILDELGEDLRPKVFAALFEPLVNQLREQNSHDEDFLLEIRKNHTYLLPYVISKFPEVSSLVTAEILVDLLASQPILAEFLLEAFSDLWNSIDEQALVELIHKRPSFYPYLRHSFEDKFQHIGIDVLMKIGKAELPQQDDTNALIALVRSKPALFPLLFERYPALREAVDTNLLREIIRSETILLKFVVEQIPEVSETLDHDDLIEAIRLNPIIFITIDEALPSLAKDLPLLLVRKFLEENQPASTGEAPAAVSSSPAQPTPTEADDKIEPSESLLLLSDILDVVIVKHQPSHQWVGNLYYLKRGNTRFVFNSREALAIYQRENPSHTLLWQKCICDGDCVCSDANGVQGVKHTLSAWLTVDKEPRYSVLYFDTAAARRTFIDTLEKNVRDSAASGSHEHDGTSYWLSKFSTKTGYGQKQNWHPDWVNVINQRFFREGSAYHLVHAVTDEVRYFETDKERERFLTHLEDYIVEPTILRLNNLTAEPILMKIDLADHKRLFEIHIDSGEDETALTSDVLSDAINIEAGHPQLRVERDPNAKGLWYVVYHADHDQSDQTYIEDILIMGSDDPNQGFLDFFFSHVVTDRGSGLTNVYLKALSSLPQLDGQIYSTQLERVPVKVSGNANRGMMIYGNHLTLTSNSETDGTFAIEKSEVIIESNDKFEKVPFTVQKNKDGKSAEFEGMVSVAQGITYRDEPGDLVPLGTIIMWSVSAGFPIPRGWVLCDGVQYHNPKTNHTVTIPDMREKFIYGVEQYAKDDKTLPFTEDGGNNEVTLIEANLPSHSHRINETIGGGNHQHSIYVPMHDASGRGQIDDAKADGDPHSTTTLYTQSGGGGHSHSLNFPTQSTGSGRSFTVKPRHIKMAFLMKIGDGYSPVS